VFENSYILLAVLILNYISKILCYSKIMLGKNISHQYYYMVRELFICCKVYWLL